MKKILMVLAAVAVAGIAQAASVSWKTTAVKIMNDAGTAVVSAGSSTAYTAMVTFWTADGLSVIGTSSDTTASMSSYGATLSDKFANNTSYLAQLTVSNDKWTISSEIAEFTVGDQDPEINFTTGNNFDVSGSKIAYTTGNWTAVPEPTSGLLILLGMAGLALKRKIA